MSWKRVLIAIFVVIVILNVFLVYAYNSQPTSTGTTDDLNAVAWKPDDSYALIVGEHGTVLKYDGNTFSSLHAPTTETLWDVAWARDGNHAIIVGEEGTILLYNGTDFLEIESLPYVFLFGATWQTNNVTFIVGDYGTVFRLEEENLTQLPSRTSNDLRDIEWYPDGGYGLIVGDDGTVLREFGTDYEELQSDTTNDLWKVSWRPFHDEALIVGESGTAIIYDHLDPFRPLSTGVSNWLTDVTWYSDGKQALIVGTQGLLLRYDGKDFSRETSATSGYLGGVDWKNHEASAILVGGNGIVRKYPNLLLSPELIIIIWVGEIFLGMGAAIVLIYNFATSKKRKEHLPTEEAAVTKSKGEVKIYSAINLKSTDLFYKVKIENKTSLPISDIKIKPYLSKELFTLDRDEENIPLIRPNDSKTVKFRIRPQPEGKGEADILGRITYYEPEIDGYEEKLLKPRPIKITWPEMKAVKISEEEWGEITRKLLKAEETIVDIPFSGGKCMEFAIDIVIGKGMAMIVKEVKEEETYVELAKFYALGEGGPKYAAELKVEAGERDEAPSQLEIKVYTESRESLLGLYYLLVDEIYHGLEAVERDLMMMKHVADFKSRIERMEKDLAKQRTLLTPGLSEEAKAEMEPRLDLYEKFDTLRQQIEAIEKDKIGVDSKYRSLYELDELYKILAEDMVKRKIVDIKVGEGLVKEKLDKKHLEDLMRFREAYALLCEAETSESLLVKEDFPDSGKKAILLVYFNAVEIYVREKLKELIPKGVTILLGEDYGHINTRKKDWERIWDALSLGSCIHIINNNRYLFLKDEELWERKVERLMHQVRELRNTVAHPSKKNPDPRFVRRRVYELLTQLPEILKSKE